VVAPIIPPSIIAVIYAWMAEESVAAMFAAGILPGLLVGGGMAVPVFIIAKKRNYPKEPPPTLPEFMAVLQRALPALMIPAIIMGGILFGLFTPTEAAAVAVLYALVVPPIFYREPALRELPAIFADSARLSGVIGLIIGFVGAFGWVLTYSKFPFVVAEAIAAIAPQWWLFIMLVIVLYLILGTFMEELSMMISTIPITTPLMVQAGFDSVWYGILIVLLIQTAMISPPFGINLFVIHGIRGRGTLSDVEKGAAPFVVSLLLMILLICIYPEIVMWLPRIVG